MNLPLNIDVQQILLHMLNFVILFGGMYFILYKPVKDFMDKRTEKYKEERADIENNLKEAQAAREEYTKKLENAEKEIAEKMAEAEKEAEKSAQLARKKAESEASEIIAQARNRAEAEKKEILGSAKKDVAALAAEAAEKVVYKDASEAYDGFLDIIEDYDENN